ncbi:MAG: hypothetical protein U0414_31455 [Polyangiaceae bacterium]
MKWQDPELRDPLDKASYALTVLGMVAAIVVFAVCLYLGGRAPSPPCDDVPKRGPIHLRRCVGALDAAPELAPAPQRIT